MSDFLARGDPRPQEAENLALVGAMDGWGAIPAILQQLKQEKWQPGQMPLFDWAAASAPQTISED